MDSLVDRDDLVERWPGKDAEGVVDVGGPPHAVQHAANTRGAGQHPEGLAREAISISLGRIIHIEVNNLPSGLRLRPACAGRRSGPALSPAAPAGLKPAGAAEPAPAGALFTNGVSS